MVSLVDWTKLDENEQLETAKLIIEDIDRDSTFISSKSSREFPVFARKELGLGSILGVGSFCNVEEILAIRMLFDKDDNNFGTNEKQDPVEQQPNGESSDSDTTDLPLSYHHQDDDDEDNMDDLIYSRSFMKNNCLRENEQNNTSEARYAIKRIKRDLPRIEEIKGLIDLGIETKLLKVLSHPNIVKMRAISCSDMLSQDFFIVLDRLYRTLEDKIDLWIFEKKSMNKLRSGCGKSVIILNELWLEQTIVAYDLSSAFTYLHKNKIIYRDVKPNNIGFDVRGDVKLFDFGLSRELRPCDKVKDGLYKLTGVTGSRRYMAPEVVLCKPYGLSADIYSFAIALHEIFSCQIPFELYDIREHLERVVKRNTRPKIPKSWPGYLKKLLVSAWSPNIPERPNFQRIKSLLKTDMNLRAGGGLANRSNEMMERSRRSVHSFTRKNNSLKELDMDKSDHSLR